VASAILSGEEFTGVSIMLMDEGLDSGPVLARAQVPILAADTTGSLNGKLSRIGAQLLLEVLPRWLKGEITPQPQDEASASYCRPISKEAGEIDWRLPVVDIWRQVRAYNPWPSSYSRWRGRRLKIIEAVPLPGVKEGEAGEVVPLAQVGAGAALAFGVSTGEGVLGVLKVQLEGKRVTSGASFLRGQPGFVGEWLGLS
jgi:methionyl-tRNA formyltransferase